MEPKWIKNTIWGYKIIANGGPLNRLGCGGGLGRPSANESKGMLVNSRESYGMLYRALGTPSESLGILANPMES